MKTMAMVLLVAGFASSLRAADLAGSFTWVGTAEERAAVEKAVALSADSANMLIRPVVRKKLTASTHPYTNITLSVSNDSVRFNRDFSNRPINGNLAAPPLAWERDDGKVFQVSYTREGDTLRQTFTDADGTRVNVFAVTPDGAQLTMSVTIMAGVLKTPVSYTLSYRKTQGL